MNYDKRSSIMRTSIHNSIFGGVVISSIYNRVHKVYFGLETDCMEIGIPTELEKRVLQVVNYDAEDKDIPLSFGGTDFQIKVWRALQLIPRGETRTYKQVAESIGMPKAVRAVANACGANPIVIVVPCHRVIRSDGGLGGYSSGAEIKMKLLERENYR